MLFAAPIVIIIVLLIIPVGEAHWGGISEYADQFGAPGAEEFDKLFPDTAPIPLTLVTQTNHQPVTDAQIADIRSKALAIGGFSSRTAIRRIWLLRACLRGRRI